MYILILLRRCILNVRYLLKKNVFGYSNFLSYIFNQLYYFEKKKKINKFDYLIYPYVFSIYVGIYIIFNKIQNATITTQVIIL